MAKKQNTRPANTKKEAPKAAPSQGEGLATVRAVETGFYNGVRIRPGTVFTIPASLLGGSWFEVISAPVQPVQAVQAPEPSTETEDAEAAANEADEADEADDTQTEELV